LEITFLKKIQKNYIFGVFYHITSYAWK